MFVLRKHNMNYNDAYNFIKTSLMYQMSLGSKELYHSNVWAWLMEMDPNFVKVFIDIKPEQCKVVEIRREQKNRDITIKLISEDKKYCYIIENKIKSLPTIEQLTKYTNNIDDYEMAGGILTGIGECTLNLNEVNGKVTAPWKYIEYDEIAKGIWRVAQESKKETIINHLKQIEEYCDIIKAIKILVATNLEKYPDRLSYNYGNEINELRIADIIKKQKGSIFLRKAIKELQCYNKLAPEGFKFIVQQAFYNTHVVLDFRFSNWSENKPDYLLMGIQIEDDQFRLVAERNYGNKPEEIFNQFANMNWFDGEHERSKKRITLNGKEYDTRLSKRYDKYSKENSYIFLYQYFVLNESNDSFDNLIKLIKEFLDQAINVLGEIKKQTKLL